MSPVFDEFGTRLGGILEAIGPPLGRHVRPTGPIAPQMPDQSRFFHALWRSFVEDVFLECPGQLRGRGRHVIRTHRRSPNAVFQKHTLAPKGSIWESLWEAFGRLWATFARLGQAPGRFFHTGGAVLVLLQ